MPRTNHIPTCQAARRRGFTLIEAMVSLTVTSIAATAVLLTLNSSLQQNQYALEQSIAGGLANQMIDEIASCAILGDPDQHRFVSVAAYNNLDESPPRDPWGIELGSEDRDEKWRSQNLRLREGYLASWRRQVTVEPASGGHRVTVRIAIDDPLNGQRPVYETTTFVYSNDG